MTADSLIQDIRYAIRGLRRAPLFAASVAGTIELGLGILDSAFTIINAYLLKPIDLPNPRELYAPGLDASGGRPARAHDRRGERAGREPVAAQGGCSGRERHHDLQRAPADRSGRDGQLSRRARGGPAARTSAAHRVRPSNRPWPPWRFRRHISHCCESS